MQLDELHAGQKLRVIKSFLDFDSQKIKEGSEWTFENYTYFVYDGGYTFNFKEGVIQRLRCRLRTTVSSSTRPCQIKSHLVSSFTGFI